jgi:isocitrate/isopropylmalate dehydrogenase
VNRIGLIAGAGTGRELSDAFTAGAERLAKVTGREVEIVACGHEFKTYHQMIHWEPERIEEAVQEDLALLTDFYHGFYRAGGRAVFRTAINAETLYRFRTVGKAVKTVYIPLKQSRLLFVRDQTQGFYANDSYRIGDRELHFSGSFSRENMQLVADYSLAEGDRLLRKPYDVWVVYKHHLFANTLEAWARDLCGGAGVFQPNHATDLLFDFAQRDAGPDLLAVVGNEVGDILHEVLIFNLKLGTRNTLHSRNVYLHPDLSGLVEYQTVHGSADGIGGRGVVNPLATLRALGACFEEQLGVAGFGALVEVAIREAAAAGIVGHDAGGSSSTAEIAEAVLGRIERLAASGD